MSTPHTVIEGGVASGAHVAIEYRDIIRTFHPRSTHSTTRRSRRRTVGHPNAPLSDHPLRLCQNFLLHLRKVIVLPPTPM